MNFINKIRLSFLKKNLLIVLVRIRFLRIEIPRLKKIYDEIMVSDATQFHHTFHKYSGLEFIAEYKKYEPFLSFCLAMPAFYVKIDDLEKELDDLLNMRKELHHKVGKMVLT